MTLLNLIRLLLFCNITAVKNGLLYSLTTCSSHSSTFCRGSGFSHWSAEIIYEHNTCILNYTYSIYTPTMGQNNFIMNCMSTTLKTHHKSCFHALKSGGSVRSQMSESVTVDILWSFSRQPLVNSGQCLHQWVRTCEIEQGNMWRINLERVLMMLLTSERCKPEKKQKNNRRRLYKYLRMRKRSSTEDTYTNVKLETRGLIAVGDKSRCWCAVNRNMWSPIGMYLLHPASAAPPWITCMRNACCVVHMWKVNSHWDPIERIFPRV